MRHKRATLALAVAVLAIATTGWGNATAAQAAPENSDAVPRPVQMSAPVPAGFASWQEVLAEQDRLNGVADAIVEASSDSGTDEGFGAVTANPVDHKVRLYWKGSVPADVQQIATHTEAVQVLPAAYSAVELRQAAERIMQLSEVAGAPDVTGVAPLPDASGLRVTMSEAAAEARSWSGLSKVGMTITVEGEKPATPFVGRWHDIAPFFGGGVWHTESHKAGCSTGFAVRPAFTTPAPHYLLTAAHCARRGAQIVRAGDLSVDEKPPMIGSIESGDVRESSDAALIKIESGASASPRVWNNDRNHPEWGEFSNPVNTYNIGAHVGNYVCASGAFSGTRCNAQVTSTDEMHKYPDSVPPFYFWVWPLDRAESLDGLPLAGKGDSGAPVFGVTAYDASKVNGMGIVAGGVADGATDCINFPGVSVIDRDCSSVILFAPMKSTLYPSRGLLKLFALDRWWLG